MKEKITQFSKGVFQFEKPSLLFSQKLIEFSIESGNEYHGFLTVTTEKKQKIKGVACSEEHFLRIKEKSFCGTDVTIEYIYDATGLTSGETHSGSIRIISNCGEYEIPFMAKVEMPFFQTSIGKVKDLFQFANLAKRDWLEALKIFQSDKFEEKLLSQDSQNHILYRSLIKSVSASHALEEFLIAVHKKVCTDITVDRTVLEYSDISEAVEDSILLTRNNWGFLEVHVSADCDFIEPERKMIWNENFLNNQFALGVRIHAEKLKGGMNQGRILLRTPYQSILIQIHVYAKGQKKNRSQALHRQSLAFIQNYLNFRMNRIDSEQYIAEMKQLQNEYYESGEMDEYYLIKAHLSVAQGDEAEMENVFEQLEDRKKFWESDSNYCCAFEYLSAMRKQDASSIEEANERIDDLYRRTNGEWRIFWFLLNVNQELMTNQKLKYETLEALLERGVYSPVLYFEMAVILNQDFSCVTELEGARLRVLNWMIKENFISVELSAHYIYLASRVKLFVYPVYRSLKIIYERTENQEALQAIIGMLIRSQKSAKKYFKWYQLGVEKQIRITQLYEFYMYSVEEDLNHIFPKGILDYFSMSINLDESRRAFFYANLLHNKEEYGTEYLPYLDKIKEFGRKELIKKVINQNLAVIYEELIKDGVLDDEEKEMLPYIMFRHELICRNPDITGAIVIHGEMKEETFFPLENGKAQVQIFTDNAQIFLTDRSQNRYANTIEYSLKKYILADNLAEICLPRALDNGMLLLYLYEQIENFRKYAKTAQLVRKRLFLIDGLEVKFKWNCYMKLVQYYFDSMELEELDNLLETADFEYLCPEDRVRLFHLCVTRKKDVGLLLYLDKYGYEEIEPKKLLRYVEYYTHIHGTENLPEVLLEICMFLIRKGKCTRELIWALQSQYIGCLEDLRLIWDEACRYNITACELEEQIICQTLFTECGRKNIIPVFVSYYQKEQKDKLVLDAFMSYYSYKFLVKERVLQPVLIELMQEYIRHSDNKMVMLAILKVYSAKEKLSEEEANFVEIHLNQFVKDKRILPFFLDFKSKIPLPFELANKYYVKYVSSPESQVTIHYSVENGAGNKTDFKEEAMKNVFYGIFVKEFVLFHGDRLQYYITEKRNGIASITESILVQFQDDMSGDESEYSMLNSLLVANEMQDSEAVLALFEQYLTTQYMITEKFKKLD